MFATRVQVRAPVMAMRSRRAVRMAPAAVIDDVREVIADQMGLELDVVTPEATFIDDLDADSLDTVEVMMALEDKFGVQIDNTVAENIRTVSDVADVVEKIQSGELPMPPPAADKAEETKPAEAKSADNEA